MAGNNRSMYSIGKAVYRRNGTLLGRWNKGHKDQQVLDYIEYLVRESQARRMCKFGILKNLNFSEPYFWFKDFISSLDRFIICGIEILSCYKKIPKSVV